MPRSSNFTDAQKAELFVLHRAICVYSGEKLWLLDGGVTPNFIIDWADHLHPVAKGGASTVDNGVCASWYYNQRKRDSMKVPKFLFYKGKPTKHYFAKHDRVPRRLQRDLSRLASLHHSDWYFNRAVFRLLLGIAYLAEHRNVRIRDDRYYAEAALKSVKKWRTITERECVPSLEDRRLAPRRPSRDKQMILTLREIQTAAKIRALMKTILPTYVAQL